MNFNSKTNKENIIRFKNFRISVLKQGVIRIEKSDKEFNDYPTQMVLFRNFNSNEFEYETSDDEITIHMINYDLVFNGNVDESFVVYKGIKILFDRSYNLGGTYETVDGMDGEIQTLKGINYQIGDGVCSKNGLVYLDDSNSYCFNDFLNFSHINKDELDIYIFFYPNDYIGAVRDYFELSGYPPKLPKYVFGNWWSRYYAYTQSKYLYLMDEFKYNNIPFTVATVDMDWHYSSSNGRRIIEDLEMDEAEFIKDLESSDNKYYISSWHDHDENSKGWTGYTWNKKLFPDYEKFLEELHKRGLAVTLNLHPADGISFYEEMYERCCKRLGLEYKSKETIPFDLTDEDNKKMFFEEILNYYEDKGVDFWWVDWQQGSFSKFPGLTPMWLCNHYFYLDREKHINRPLLLSRFCGLGGHRYPLGFSGDSYQTFASLKYLVKTTSQASNAGFSYWSHDIGGHMMGIKDGDLYLKFIQFGVFSPILRIHSSSNEVSSKEPSLFLNGYGDLINKYLRLRHQMIPYIYSFSLRTTYEGRCLIEPLYYHHPLDEKAYEYADSEYYFASDLLVAPITEKKDKNGSNIKDVYFPKGVYYDLKYGYRYKGGKSIKIIRDNGDMPVFIKEGAFFVIDHNNVGNSLENPKHLQIVTTRGDGKYDFYEDDGDSQLLKTTFMHNENGLITIKITGDKTLYMKNRIYSFKLLNVFNYSDIICDGARLLEVTNDGGFLEFSLTELEFDRSITTQYSYQTLDKLKLAIKYTTARLMYIDDDNIIRNDLFNKVCEAQTYKEVVYLIKQSKLKTSNINKLLEVIKL